MTTPAPGATPPPPDRLQFRANSATGTAPAVDAARGAISGVSLITGDREASGHGLWIDARTLAGFLGLLDGKPLKSYVTHCLSDATLREVGYWQKPVVDGAHLRADFVALDAWRKHSAAEFDTLFELAKKLPSEFGASLSFRFTLAWVKRDGTESTTVRKWRSGANGYEAFFDPPAPAGALRELPSVRPVEVYSADFVDQPAANAGLFSVGRTTTPPSESDIQKLRRELNAIKGTDATSSAQRGALAAKLRALRDSTPSPAIAQESESASTIETLRAQLAAIVGNTPSAARRRGALCAQIKALRAA